MDSKFSSLGTITKLSSITRNLSGSHPLRPVFESLKSINNIRKTDLKGDLSKKYFGVFTNDNRNDSLKDLMSNEFKSIKSKQLCVGTNTNPSTDEVPKENPYKNQSVQTDIREFAKIRLSSDLCESASDFMQFAEEFVEELEFQCFYNSMDLTSIPTYRNRQTDFNADDNQFNGYKSFEETLSTNERLNYQICKTKDIPNQINRYPVPQSPTDMKPNTCLILNPNVIEYEADNCQNYELGVEALESQFTALHLNPKINLSSGKVSKDSYPSSVGVQSECKPIKWSDFVQLFKFNQFSKLENISNKKY